MIYRCSFAVFSGWETANKYAVRNKAGQQIYFAAEGRSCHDVTTYDVVYFNKSCGCAGVEKYHLLRCERDNCEQIHVNRDNSRYIVKVLHTCNT